MPPLVDARDESLPIGGWIGSEQRCRGGVWSWWVVGDARGRDL